MRTEMNPLRQADTQGYKPIVLAVITHLPNLEGYHEHRLNVVKCCLETMRENVGINADNFQILIWDNGSCDKLLYWLRRSYQPDFLITGPNLGKSMARSSIVNMLPSDTVVAMTDDDMFFYPDWLPPQLEILSVYPNVGTVSGWPVRTQIRFHNRSTIEWGKRYAGKFERGKFISEQEDKDFCTSIGRNYAQHVLTSRNDYDIRFEFRGVPAYAMGHHAQWIGKAGVLAPIVGYKRGAMGNERSFESATDSAGLLRLTTTKRVTRHIGNVLDEELEALWREIRS